MQSPYVAFPIAVTSKPVSGGGLASASLDAWTEDHDTNRCESTWLACNEGDALVDDHDELRPAVEPGDMATDLRAWSESPESSPIQRRVKQEENWDDDFVDNAESPVRPSARRKQRSEEENENWDAEFGIAINADSAGLMKSRRSRASIQWDAFEEDHGEDFNPDFDRDVEDKTVTSRRRKPLGLLNSEVPPLPVTAPPSPSQDDPGAYQSIFTRSPTHSAFSIPTSSGRDSISYSSTAHLALRRSPSAESSPMLQDQRCRRFPLGTPITPQKERRRLRKKSRPPHLDASIMELEDRSDVPIQGRVASSDSRPATPPPRSSSEATSPYITSYDLPIPSLSPSSKSVLSRIGYVKRWSVTTTRKHTTPSKRCDDTRPASTPPSAYTSAVEGDRHDSNKTPRPRSSVASSSDVNIEVSSPSTDRKRHSIREGPQFKTPKSSIRGKARAENKPVPIKVDRLQFAMPGQVPSQSGMSTELDLTASPRKVLKTIGHMLRSTSGKSKAESLHRSLGKQRDMSDVRPTSAAISETSHHYSHSLAGETLTLTRQRISYQLPSSLKDRSVFPRHASGSAVLEGFHSAHFSPGLSSRSISASTSGKSNEDLSQFGEGSLRKEGSRGFMGSIRRLSLTNSQKRQRKPLSCEPSPVPSDISLSCAPSDVPVSVVDRRPAMVQSLIPSVALATGLMFRSTPRSLSVPLDRASPTSGSHDMPKAPSPRKASDPTLTHSKSSSFAVATSSSQDTAALKHAAAAQAASLGRASPLPSGGSSMFRRSSLGDLKIPSRIRSAQNGLKKDLDRVREFAAHVDQMKGLRTSYIVFIRQIRALLGTLQSSDGHGTKVSSQGIPRRPNYEGLVEMIQEIDSKYVIAWECADLLIELGTGKAPDPMQPIKISDSDQQKKRERTTTVYVDEGFIDLASMSESFNDPSQEQSSTSANRGELGRRQLYLLKEMLNNADSAKEGTYMNTLKSSSSQQYALESGQDEETTSSRRRSPEEPERDGAFSPVKKRRNSRMGLLGIREMLRSIKLSSLRSNQLDGVPPSTTTISTESPFDHEGKQPKAYPYSSISGLPVVSRPSGRPRSKTSSVVDVANHRESVCQFPENLALSDYASIHRASPRRPSLASLFRLGRKNDLSQSVSAEKGAESGTDAAEEGSVIASGDENVSSVAASEKDDSDSEWDRIDAMSEMDIEAAEKVATGNPTITPKRRRRLRLSSPLPSTPKHHPYSSSQLSFSASEHSAPNGRANRLSNVEENVMSTPSASRRRAAQMKAESSTISLSSRRKEKQTSSIRTTLQNPGKAIPSFEEVPPGTDPKLAMTPENIKPLLENARVVTSRLHDCITETRDLIDRLVANLAADAAIVGGV